MENITNNGNGINEAGYGKNKEGDDFQDTKDGNCLTSCVSEKDAQLVQNNEELENNDQGDALGGALSGIISTTNARMPVPKYATHYKMNHKKRGLALIFNHEVFECHNLKARAGTIQDRQNLKAQLNALGFDVHVFNDLKYAEIDSHIKHAARMDHSDHDCLFVAVLSHGETNILYAKDTHYAPDCLWGPFTADKCPTLAGKPKIFIMQACQGDRLDAGITLQRTETDGDFQHNTYRIPTQADFLIVYSTVKGYSSWKSDKGSWYIQTLCEELSKNVDKYDFLTILTIVSQKVAIDFQSYVPHKVWEHEKKQIPCVISMLTRQIMFT